MLVSLLVAFACKDHEAERREALAKAYLAEMRVAIAKYKADTGQYPHTLDELVPKYLRVIHPDPLTNAADWRVTTEETVQPSSDFQTTTAEASQPVIIEVRSNAPGTDRNGVPYANY